MSKIYCSNNIYQPLKHYFNVISIKAGSCSLSTIKSFSVGTPDALADLGIYQTTEKLIYTIDENLTYKILVVNFGPSDTPSVNLINIFPCNCSLVDISSPAATYTYHNNKIFFSLNGLASNTSSEVSITVKPYHYGIIENFVWVNNPKYDSNLNNNISILKTQICDAKNCSFVY